MGEGLQRARAAAKAFPCPAAIAKAEREPMTLTTLREHIAESRRTAQQMARDYAEDDNNDMTYRFTGQVEAYDEILELIAEPPAVYHSPPQEYCDDLNCPCTLPSLRPSSGCPERGCTHCTPGNPAPCDGCQRAEMREAVNLDHEAWRGGENGDE
jgi:hypothetical protein